MMTYGRVILVTSALAAMTLQPVSGHGRMIEPPARSTMWRYGFNTPHNYNDNALNCGGLNLEWYVNHGKCGLCGDPWNQPQPRDNEAGGRYGKGIITRNYTPGQEIEVRVEITANHRGWFEFRLCSHNDPSTPITQQCLDRNLLPLADGSGTRYTLSAMTRLVDIKLKLPPGLTCSQCVLQWKWHADNNYGNVQEEFYGCSDIAIGSATARPPVFTTAGVRPTAPPTARPTAPPTTVRPTALPTAAPTAPPTTASSAGSLVCRGINSWQGDPKLDQSCAELCRNGHCPLLFCSCSGGGSGSVATTTTAAPPTAPPTAGVSSAVGSTGCRGINSWQGVPQLDRYCSEQCPLGNCPPLFCACSGPGQPATATAPPTRTTAPPTRTTAPPRRTTAPPPTAVVVSPAGSVTCHGINSWQGDPQKDVTCNELCRLGNCPPLFCACSPSGGATAPPARTTTAPAPVRTTTAPPPRTNAPPQSGACHGINIWQGVAELDQYCSEQCPLGNCPPNFCSCAGGGGGAQQATPTAAAAAATTTTAVASPAQQTITPHLLRTTVGLIPQTVAPTSATATAAGRCVAIGSWQGDPAQDAWCNQWCPTGLCPSKNCQCGVLPPATVTTPSTQQQQQCRAIGAWAGHPDLDKWCSQTCANYGCDPQYCSCGATSAASSAPSVAADTTTTTASAPSAGPARLNASCYSINTWAGNAKLSEYCNQQCQAPGGYCPPQYCACGATTAPPTAVTAGAVGGGAQCRAINTWQGLAELDQWCTEQCAKGNCPAVYCSCQP